MGGVITFLAKQTLRCERRLASVCAGFTRQREAGQAFARAIVNWGRVWKQADAYDSKPRR
jgi:hypothetical protein